MKWASRAMRESTTEEPGNDLDVNDKKEAEEKNMEVGDRI